MWRRAVLLALLLALAGCQLPRDVDGTLDRARDGGALRVGLVEHEPWVSLAAEDPSGVEVGLVREFAARLGARVDYTTGTEQELVQALRRRELDLVAGGITDRTPWSKEVAMTKPYLTTHLVVGLRPGTELTDRSRVVVEAGSVAGSLVEAHTDAEPVERPSIDDAGELPVALHSWLLDDRGLVVGAELDAEEHVLLAAPGENALLVELERFLLDRKARALALLQEVTRP
jgi:polar amino acid transport system substrate-binding protein